MKYFLSVREIFFGLKYDGKMLKILSAANFCRKIIKMVAIFEISRNEESKLHEEPFALSTDKEILSTSVDRDSKIWISSLLENVKTVIVEI